MSGRSTKAYRLPALLPDTAECAECVSRLTRTLSQLPGVSGVEYDSEKMSVLVGFDEDELSEARLDRAARDAGSAASAGVSHKAFEVTGLDCPDCAATLDKSIANLDDVLAARLNFASGILVVEYRQDKDPTETVLRTIARMGYSVLQPESSVDGADRFSRQELAAAIAGALIVIGWLMGIIGVQPLATVAFAASIAVGGATTARRALASLSARALDMNVLMSVAVMGAAAIGEWSEGAMVVFLYSIGVALETRSLDRTRRSIRNLMQLAPPMARVVRDGAEVEVEPAAVLVGETLIVKSGERIAMDGVILHGLSAVDESPVTGESIPVEKGAGQEVYAGSLNTSGLLQVRVTRMVEDSTLARIIHLVEEAQARKAPTERLIDRFTRWYTPAVIALAVGIAVVPPALGLALGWETGGFSEWFYRGLVVLVVSCPCALVISTPVAVVSAITRATRMGVLVKGGVFLERAAAAKVVALDKTGTITLGKPQVTQVEHLNGYTEREVLRLAAALEAGSTHPLARAVVEAAGSHGGEMHLESFHDFAGRGVRGVIDGVEYSLGSPAAALESGVVPSEVVPVVERLEDGGLTALVLSSNQTVLGVIGVADAVRSESAAAIEALTASGIGHVVMLTGDNERTARAVAAECGVADVRAALLPEDKVAYVEELRQRHGTVVMVGDGVNDAPALAAADIGVAMGAIGSDTALETADVALMRDDLTVLPDFLDLGRRTVANVRVNVAFSVLVKFAVLVMATFGVATLWMAVFADTGVALLVVLNGLRLLRT